jgi:hypothetical protein
MDRHISRQLTQVISRFRRLHRWHALSVLWCLLALVAAGAWYASLPPAIAGQIAIAILAVGCIGTLWLWRPVSVLAAEQLKVARVVENTFPDLEQRLLTVVEQTPDVQSGGFSYLQQQLATEVRCHSYGNDWNRSIPFQRIMSRMVFAFVAIGITVFLTGRMHSTQAETIVAAQPADASAVPPAESGRRFSVSVDPGTTEVERGTSLTIVAKFDGPLPSSISMVQTGAGIQTTAIRMQQSLNEPLFGVRLPSVDARFEYRVEFDNESSETFHVSVFELPRVEQVDARVEFPSYAGIPAELIEDTWQIAAVEGSTAVLICRLNKSIETGFLVSTDDERFELIPAGDAHDGTPESGASVQLVEASPTDIETADVRNPGTPDEADDPGAWRSVTMDTLYVARIPISKPLRLRFELTDDQGRKNREDDEFLIDALPNRPAEIKLTFPAKDLRVSPIEELQLEATAWDDFGLRDHGIILAVADDPDRTISLGEEGAARQQHHLSHLVELELTGVEPDQLVSYYFFADDIAADGSMRRTMSDMFFAEVRHFEEIFREGQAPPGGQQQQQQQQGGKSAQQAEKLAELQKQIISATWNVIRRESGETVSASFGTDTQLLIESQQQALEQLGELAEKLQDAASKKYAQQIAEAMTSAVGKLQKSLDGSSAEPLSPSLRFERSAYQTLLKLRAREHEVTKQQGGGGGGGGGGAQGGSKQQMQQLELDNKKNRYEAESQAGQKQNAQQQQQNREQLQAVNRLRELARRQGDLNQKLRELKHALAAAETKKEREEIERQLKRLRDEQRDLLKDVDALRNRMERPENQQQMAESKQQLESTRSRVRQASEALEKGQLSQALNSGTRAERELQELRDDMRQKAAGQFGEAMRNLRDQAREIGQRQDRIAQQLNENENDPKQQRSLRLNRNRDGLKNEFNDQKKQLEGVLDGMREVVEKAETAEPLLARELYETVRKARSDRPGDALDESRNLVGRGLIDQAAEAERRAHDGLDRLQRGIERAADSVLGNELETLRRAQEELAGAALAIENELAQADPSQLRQARDGDPDPDSSQSGESRSGTPGEDASKPDAQARESTEPGQQRKGQSGGEATGDKEPNAGSKPGEQTPGQQPGETKPGQPKKGEGKGQPSQGGQKPGGQKGQGQQPGQSPRESPGAQSPGSTPGESKSPSSSGSGGEGKGQGKQRPQPGLRQGQNQGPKQATAQNNQGGNQSGPGAPLTGPGFQEWSDQLRNIEEMVDDPKLRAEVAQIREVARSMRIEFKRHSKEPEWDLVRMQILEPLTELKQRLREEIAKRESPDSLVPIDRDPVPDRYADLVRRYLERIGSGK